MWFRVKAKLRLLWVHRTKTLAVIGGGAAYCQNHLADMGHVLPEHLQGLLLGVFSVIVFALGLYNMFAVPDNGNP